MSTPAYATPEAIKGYFDEFLKIFNSTVDWSHQLEKLGVNVFQKAIDDSGLEAVKGTGTINASPKQVRDVVWSIDTRPKWDTFFDTGKVVRVFEQDKAVLLHYKTKSSTMVWPRDFCSVTAQRENADGSFTVVIKSVLDESVSEIDGNVRARCIIAGFHIEPEGSQTKITYIFQVDGGGWVPTAVVNLANKYQPLGIIGLRKVLTGKPQP